MKFDVGVVVNSNFFCVVFFLGVIMFEIGMDLDLLIEFIVFLMMFDRLFFLLFGVVLVLWLDWLVFR